MSTNSGAIELRSDAVVSLESLSNSNIAVSNGIKVGIGVDLLVMESSSDHHREGGLDNAEKGSIDEARVSGDEIGIVLENVEKGSIDDARVSGNERGTVMENVEKGSIDDARVPGDERGVVLENVVKGSIDDARVSEDERAVVLGNVEKSSIDDARVSGDERGIELENVEKSSIADSRVSGDERGIVLENVEKSSIDDSRVSGEERGTVLENVETGSIDDSGVSEDERGIALENVEKGSIDDARVSGDERVTVLEIVEKGSIDDSRVSGDERGIALENVEKSLDENGVHDEEKEGEYKASDLVWAKVKSYPWWPGQIFNPSASTNKAKKHSKKDGFLIAYFGDHTFAWNNASKIKPFRKFFSKMEKQSNTKSFCNALNCALDEVSRRVEFGLACSCLSDEVYNKIKTQVFVNAGIRKESSRIEGGDNFSMVATFKPANVVQSVQDLALEPFEGVNRLEVSCIKAQLLAFYRWKGCYQLPSHHILDESDNSHNTFEDKVVEDAKPDSLGEKILSRKRKSKACDNISDNSELPLMEEDKNSQGEKVLSKKRKLKTCDSVSRKRKHAGNGGTISSKKERFLKSLTTNGSSSVPNRDNKNKKDVGKRKTVESNGFMEENRNGSSDRNSSISSPKKLFRVGDSISKIAKQLSQSPPILKKESQMSKTHVGQKGVDQTEENAGGSATALILKFTSLDSIPSVTNLNEIFSRYGAVREMETEVLKKSNCVKVVFETQSKAEMAFSSAGKFSIFGPALISYRLDYSPKKKQNKKDGEAV